MLFIKGRLGVQALVLLALSAAFASTEARGDELAVMRDVVESNGLDASKGGFLVFEQAGVEKMDNGPYYELRLSSERRKESLSVWLGITDVRVSNTIADHRPFAFYLYALGGVVKYCHIFSSDPVFTVKLVELLRPHFDEGIVTVKSGQ